MILGILSDSHGRHRRTARAIRLLQGLGAEALVHCGDLGSEAVLDELVGLRAWFVWGNTDSAGPLLRNYARVLGLPVPETIPLRLELAGRSIAVFHGHEPQFTALARRIQHHLGRVTSPDIAARQENPRRIFGATLSDCDYILYGHSHKANDARVGRVRLINPGALERARPHTVATLDLKRDLVRFWQVDDHAADGDPPRQVML